MCLVTKQNRTENSLQINGKGIVPTPHGPEAEKNSRGKPPIPRIINETIYVSMNPFSFHVVSIANLYRIFRMPLFHRHILWRNIASQFMIHQVLSFASSNILP